MTSPWRRLIDAACVLTLTALVLFGFDETFSGRAYLSTGMTAAVVVVLIAAGVLAGRGPSTGVFVLIAAVLYIPIGAVAVFRSFQDGRVPTGEELLDVLTATLTGAEQLLTTIPPLDPLGGVLVVPYALGYLAAGTSIWLAFRTDRALAPVVPLLIAQAFVILLGPFQPGNDTLMIWGGFAALAFWWGSWRGSAPREGRREVVHADRGRLGRAVAAGLVVGLAFAVVTQVIAPTSAKDRTVLRGRIGSGASIDQLDNPLASFRRFTDQSDGSPDNAFAKTLFVVSGLEEPTPMRFVTLDTYDGTAWRAGNRTVADVQDDLYQRIGSVVAAPRPGTPVEVNVEMRAPYTGAWLPLVGQLTGIEFDFVDGEAQREDVRYNPATSSATVVGGLGPGDDYTFTATIPTTALAKNSTAYPVDERLQPAGAALDSYLQPYISSGRDPLTQVRLLARYLQKNGRYSDGAGALNVPPGHDIDRLAEAFVGGGRIVGNDEQYAAFVALAANRLKVPARVVVGAMAKDGKVKGRDVMAWVELRVRDGSWRILPTATFMSNRKPKRDDEPPQSLAEFVAAQTPKDPIENPESPEQVPLPDDSGLDQSSKTEETDSTLPIGGPPLALLVLALVPWLIPLSKAARRGYRRRRRPPSTAVVGAWRELLDLGADLRIPTRPGATRQTQAADLGIDPALASRADDLVFALGPPDAAAAADFWRDADRARRGLLKQNSLPRQIRAQFSLASLAPNVRRPRFRARVGAT